jgi:hypothetical protein
MVLRIPQGSLAKYEENFSVMAWRENTCFLGITTSKKSGGMAFTG